MQYITINQLNGIPDSYINILSGVAKEVKREELLTIILFFMSGLDDESHNHKSIEKNMKKIHNGQYKDYAASNIRGYFDKETQDIKQGKLNETQRLFKNIKKGYWRNTTLGNILAKRVLEKCGYDVFLKEDTMDKCDLQELAEIEQTFRNIQGKERIAEIKVRVNQGRFRKNLLQVYSSCVLCNLSKTDLLIASHIKSWSDISAANYILSKKGNLSGISLFGQELNSDAYNLCKMNTIIRNLEVDLGTYNGDTLTADQHKDMCFDYILANPPFNQTNYDLTMILDDERWQFGNPVKSNINFAYLQHCIYHLSPQGILSIILPTSTLMSYSHAEREIREKLIKADLVESIVTLPEKQFHNTNIPSCIWIINKAKKQKEKVLFIDTDKLPPLNQSSACKSGLQHEHVELISNEISEFRAGKINHDHHYAAEVTQSEIVSKNFCLLPSPYIISETFWDHNILENNIQEIKQQADVIRKEIAQLVTDMKI